MTNRFFVEPEGLSGPELWLHTDDDRYPLVLRKAELPGPYDELLWRVVTSVLAPDDATGRRMAWAITSHTRACSCCPTIDNPERLARIALHALADPDTGGDP